MKCEYINSKGKKCRKKATGIYRGKNVCTDCYNLLIWKGRCESYTNKRKKNKEND
jgi:hypothetical protein